MAPEQPIGERVAALEAAKPYIDQKLEDMDAKLDRVLAAQAQQKGMAKLGNLILNAAIGAAAAVGGFFAARGHA